MTPLPAPCRSLTAPVGAVLAARRSVRVYGDRILQVDELSTLLHHAAGVIRSGRNDSLGDYALRPFPGGGARSELEVYVVAQAVDGLAAGAYRYQPWDHAMEQLRGRDDGHAAVLRRAHDATGGLLNADPPVVVLISAVLARIIPKYPEIGTRLVYLDTGGLLQTLYLVSTALGLAPCALGGGDEAADGEWLGLDPGAEPLVGYFLLGPAISRPPTGPS